MLKGLNIGFFSVFFSLIYGCSNVNNRPIIKFSADSSAIVVGNIKKADLLHLKTLLEADSNISDYLKVTVSPTAEGSVQAEKNVLGRLEVSDSVVFIPHNRFIPGKSYLVQSFIGAKFASMGGLLTGKAKTTVEPEQKILVR